MYMRCCYVTWTTPLQSPCYVTTQHILHHSCKGRSRAFITQTMFKKWKTFLQFFQMNGTSRSFSEGARSIITNCISSLWEEIALVSGGLNKPLEHQNRSSTIDNHVKPLFSSFNTEAISAAPSCVIALPSLGSQTLHEHADLGKQREKISLHI